MVVEISGPIGGALEREGRQRDHQIVLGEDEIMHRRHLRYRQNPPLPWLAMPVKVIEDQTDGPILA